MGRLTKEQLRKRKRNAHERWRYHNDPAYRASRRIRNPLVEKRRQEKRRARYHNDPVYREMVRERQRRHGKKYRAKLRKMGLTTHFTPRLSKKQRSRAARNNFANNLEKYMASLSKEEHSRRMSKISRERWASLSKEERAKAIRPMQEKSWAKARLLKKIKSLLGEDAFKALKARDDI